MYISPSGKYSLTKKRTQWRRKKDAVVRLEYTLTPKSYNVDNGAHLLLYMHA